MAGETLAEIRRALARSCMAAFVRHTMPAYRMGWVHEEVCAELDAFLADVVAGRSPRLMLTMPPRHGKLCADDTPVLTVDGWKTHGALKVGDYVFHPSGKPVRVVAVGEKNFATHSVVFTNGDIIDVHLDHEWRVYDRTKPGYRTVETRYFVEPSKKTKALRKLDSGIPDTRGHRYLYQVDTADAPQWPAVEHVIPPYVLGVWLGDGTSIAPRINMAPDDACVVKMEFERLGVPITGTWVHRDTGVETFSFASGVKNRRNIFSQALKDADLLKNKHIPNEYKHDSLENRLDLLAGLIDTDGHFDRKTNRYRFTTSNELLAHDVEELAMLCGFVAHTNIPALDNRERTIKNKSQVYVVSFFFSGVVVPCRLERKKVNKTFSSLRRRVSIKCVRALESPKMGNCIQVDSPDGLYLVGKHLTITHNSELASRRFPAYALGRYPDLSVISTSYAADLSSRMNRDVQRVIDSPEYRELFPGTALYGKNIRTVGNGSYLRNSDIFEIVGHAGCYRSAGVGGGITGMGGHIVIVDDPFKDRASADSPTIRQNVWDWYTSTLYTRLAPGGGVLIINTRWHMADLSGRLLEAAARGEGDHWRVVNFPAIATEDEPHRKAGEALHPERYPLEQLLAIKKALGTRDWEALYQQRPTPDGGAIFKSEWLRFWLPKDLPEQFDQLLISWDMTFKDGDDTDFVVGQVWGRKGADRYLLDQVRRRMGFTDTVAAFRALAAKWPGATRKLVEDKANGPAVIDALKHAVPGIIPVEPDGSKTARAHAVTTFFEAGNVLIPHPEHCPWAREYVAELTQFPGAPHDDQCFAAGTLVATLRGGIPIEKVKEGDFVVTPQGFRRVLFAGKTGESVLLYRHGIFATANHPFMKTSGEVCKFAEIEKSELVHMTIRELLVWIFRKELNLMASPMPSWQGGNTILVSQKQTQVGKIRRGFMSLFGNTTVARKSLKGMRFITKMVIHITTILTTLSVYHVVNTAKRLSKTKKNAVSTLKKYALLLLSGTGAKKAVHGIESKAGRHTQKESILSMFVSTAARRIKRAIREKTASVPIIVKSNGDITMNTSLPRVCANGAANRSHTRPEPAEKTKYVNSAASLAAQATSTPNAVPVYNLTVEGEHLYFANGVLVHNCDATTQALRDFDAKRPMSINPAILTQPRIGYRFR
jgi:predicted phage terminase large subunit-like protein